MLDVTAFKFIGFQYPPAYLCYADCPGWHGCDCPPWYSL